MSFASSFRFTSRALTIANALGFALPLMIDEHIPLAVFLADLHTHTYAPHEDDRHKKAVLSAIAPGYSEKSMATSGPASLF